MKQPDKYEHNIDQCSVKVDNNTEGSAGNLEKTYCHLVLSDND